jgi:hypothetical protein
MMQDNTKKLNTLIARLQPELKDLGFRKRNATFNRRTDEDLVQVINFQLARVGFAADVGSVTINLAIAIPGLERFQSYPRDHSKFLKEIDCDIRQRIGLIRDLPDGVRNDLWWPLDDARTADEVERLLFGRAMEWFEELGDAERLARKLEAAPATSRVITHGTDRMWAVKIRLAQGEQDRAQANFDEYLKTLHEERLIAGMGRFAAMFGLDFSQ